MTRTKPLILNVDDDRAGQYAVDRTLKQAGYDVEDASSGDQALRLACDLKPEIILLDIRLPDIDGFEVCRRIRENPDIAGTPIIQMSASYLDTGSRVRGLENGADAYLTEPVEPAVLLATIRSILRIRRAEQTVRRSDLQWQITFNAIRDGVALLDEQGKIIQCNEAFNRVAGPFQSAVEKPVRHALSLLRSGAGRQTVEVVIDAATLLLTLDPVQTEAGFDGAVCVVSDITEKKRFEADLRESAKLESIGVLAGGIAHDFNNLLTGIIGNSGLLLDMVSAGAPERELIQEILRAGESAADLTRQILAYAGKARFLKVPVNISVVAEESRAFVRRFIPPRVGLIYETQPNLPPISGDPSQVQQLIMNLVINAAESFGESGRGVVMVKTAVERLDPSFFRKGEKSASGDYAVLTVSDTGSGMDENTQRRIFEPFFTTKFAGRGLGLSAVHGILKSHSGYLRMESTVGQGTTFRLYFPVIETAQPRFPVTAKTPSAGEAEGTILFVDDEPIVRNFAKTALQNRGYRVLLAENGQVAVEEFEKAQEAIKLVILDFAMPVMNGEEAFENLRRMSSGVPIILSSGFSQSVAAEKFKGGDLAGFLGKPYSGSQLVAAVEAALKVRR